MLDAILKIAYRIAPEPFARRISETIWQRDMDRLWRSRVAAHIAAGGTHVVTTVAGISHEELR